MAISYLHTYPQKYFLEGEALKHFGIKTRTYKNWLDSGLTIPGNNRTSKKQIKSFR